MKRTFCLIALACVACPFVSRAADKTEQDIRIGLREDTPPFVSVDPESGAFVGYFYDVCTTGVTRAGYQFTEHVVDAASRQLFLESGHGNYDLLCDPTTITLARMANFSPRKKQEQDKGDRPTGLDYSQIVFMANGAYAISGVNKTEAWVYATQEWATQNVDGDLPASDGLVCKDVFAEIGSIEYTPVYDAEEGQDPPPQKAWKLSDFIVFRHQEPPAVSEEPEDAEEAQPERPKVEIGGFVVGATIRESAMRDASTRGNAIACSLPSHVAAAQAFCEGKLDRYYGDLDVVRASIKQYQDLNEVPCPFEEPDQDQFTYEPYAFVISARVKEFPERFRCAIYSMFQDGTMESLYRGRFGSEKTDFLAALFEINSIPSGRKHPDKKAELCGIAR